MVGPISTAERESAALRVKLAATLLVGASAGLITLQGDAPLWMTAAAVGAGLVVGAAVVWFVFPGTGEVAAVRERREREATGDSQPDRTGWEPTWEPDREDRPEEETGRR